MIGPKLCECGCGLPAPVAKKTDTSKGVVKGQPTRFIRGHNPSGRPQKRSKPDRPATAPMPADARPCECGCGQPAPAATHTNPRRGLVRGQPTRFIRGHGGIAKIAATATERYLEDLIHRSKLIVAAVRDDGPDELLRQIDLALAMQQPDGIDPAVALVTVLAAQIDPDTTDEQRLGWVRAFDRAAAQAPTPPRQLPVRASPRKETAA